MKAKILVKAGFLTIEGILAAEIEDIVEMTSLDLKEAKLIYSAAAKRTESDTHTDATGGSDDGVVQDDDSRKLTEEAEAQD